MAEAHHRELPEIVREKARGIDDPDKRVIAMLGARAAVELTEVRGSGVAVADPPEMKKAAVTAAFFVREGGLEPWECRLQIFNHHAILQ